MLPKKLNNTFGGTRLFSDTFFYVYHDLKCLLLYKYNAVWMNKVKQWSS